MSETAKTPAKPTPAKPTPTPVAELGLVKVTKDGETLLVHPTALAAHLRLGWKQ